MLGKSAYEIENTFTASELSEWAEYLQDNPPPFQVAEMQRAVMSSVLSSQWGGDAKPEDFIISGKNETRGGGIHDLTVEEINAIAGV